MMKKQEDEEEEGKMVYECKLLSKRGRLTIS